MTLPLALAEGSTLSNLWARLQDYLPTLLGALGILAVGWLVAWVISLLVRVTLEKTGLDDRLAGFFDSDTTSPKGGAARVISRCVYYLLLLFVLVAFLQQLGLTLVTEPLNNFLNQVFEYAPRVLGAVVILGVAWLLATVVKFLVTSALGATRMDEALAGRTGIGAGESKPMSGLLGEGLYWLILLLFLPAALGALDIPAVTEPVSGLVDSILGSLPGVIAATLVIVIAFFIGRIVRGLVASLLAGVGFDGLPKALGFASVKSTSDSSKTPSYLVGMLVQVAILVFAAAQALPMIGLDQLSVILNEFVAFASQVLLGLVILGLGLYLSRLAADAILSTKASNASTMASFARIAILVLTGAMALRRMGLADDIVNTAFSYSLGAVALAAAIAFGVGGREVAGNLLTGWVTESSGGGSRRKKPATQGAGGGGSSAKKKGA